MYVIAASTILTHTKKQQKYQRSVQKLTMNTITNNNNNTSTQIKMRQSNQFQNNNYKCRNIDIIDIYYIIEFSVTHFIFRFSFSRRFARLSNALIPFLARAENNKQFAPSERKERANVAQQKQEIICIRIIE